MDHKIKDIQEPFSELSLSLLEKIKNKRAVVGIIGLGYVGLPLALHFGLKGFPVLGFDVDESKIKRLKRGESYIKHIDTGPFLGFMDRGVFDATSDFSRLPEADCIVVCVPTPLTEKKNPDLSYLIGTSETIAANLRKGQLIILESTTYPGTTEEMVLPFLCSGGYKVGADFFLAFSPEREDPGNANYNGTNTPKIVGGVTQVCLECASSLYRSYTEVVQVSSTKAAELTKLLENVYRSVNIALVNELKVLAHKMGVDIFEVIEAASTKPFGFTPFYPGPGLGGHCIPIDPFYLAWKAQEFDCEARFIRLAGEINVSMPYYVVEKTAEALNHHKKCLKDSRILLLGMAYKKNIDDERESPGYVVMDLLLKRGALVEYNDPFIPSLKPTRKYDFTKESVSLDADMISSMDAVVVITGHSGYDVGFLLKHAQMVVDTRNITSGYHEYRDKIFTA